ncbi:hypothetical protein [Bacillus sp. FSL K6-3431]|uniref:hypothetical protein n=1 Tax=Bacillus sp. FSL K6-3431 TaxID=2921500 RepID=UPI0030FD0B02
MLNWILIITIPIIAFALFEELIYFFVNRIIFRVAAEEEMTKKVKWSEKIKLLTNKLRLKDKSL